MCPFEAYIIFTFFYLYIAHNYKCTQHNLLKNFGDYIGLERKIAFFENYMIQLSKTDLNVIVLHI